jgi:hypothetical protein
VEKRLATLLSREADLLAREKALAEREAAAADASERQLRAAARLAEVCLFGIETTLCPSISMIVYVGVRTVHVFHVLHHPAHVFHLAHHLAHACTQCIHQVEQGAFVVHLLGIVEDSLRKLSHGVCVQGINAGPAGTHAGPPPVLVVV